MSLTNPAFLWPIIFAEDDPEIRVECNSVTSDLTLSVEAGREYWFSGDSDTDDDEADLVKIFEDCINSHPQAPSGSAAINNETHHLSINACSPSIDILWSHANTTVDSTIFGWPGADTGSASSQ